jgi:hypothetical protein
MAAAGCPSFVAAAIDEGADPMVRVEVFVRCQVVGIFVDCAVHFGR